MEAPTPERAAWLDASWGKFRAQQRALAETDPAKLAPRQLGAAWEVWNLMRGTASAAVLDDGWAARLHAQTVELTGAMPVELRRGPGIFCIWLCQNGPALAKPIARAVAESAQTTDRATARLIR